MAKVYQIATVLYDVLRTVIPSSKVDKETEIYAKEVKRNRGQYEHYNILPLSVVGIKPAIMELPEIKAAIRAICTVDTLPMPRIHSSIHQDDNVITPEYRDMSSIHQDDNVITPEYRDKSINDIFDWLASIFGFQKGNVANQREHLILILANMDARTRKSEHYEQLDSGTIYQLKETIFKNYCLWCDYLQCKSNLTSSQSSDRPQLELLYIALYLLIWGEASNIRFMPECICYIFHNMASELREVLYNNVHPVTGDTYQTATHSEEAFLKDVVTPIYEVLRKEARRNKGGKASHSAWRNYDDLNEYFWYDLPYHCAQYCHYVPEAYFVLIGS
ncbi:Callose synthase 7 [Dionaea muscipula]